MNRIDPWGLIENELRYKELSKPSSKRWDINWVLDKKTSKGGWIVQEITVTTEFGGTHTRHYWEAWEVKCGSNRPVRTEAGYDDRFYVDYSKSHVQNDVTYKAVARFYEGLTLPDSFKINNTATGAGDLPATTINPNLPIDNATDPVERTWTARPPKKKK
jgi:hypothetical protein